MASHNWPTGLRGRFGAVSCLLVMGGLIPARAAEPIAHGEVYANVWATNVQAALSRVEVEQQEVSPSEPSASGDLLRDVRSNLVATLALYEAEGELPFPPAGSSDKGRPLVVRRMVIHESNEQPVRRSPSEQLSEAAEQHRVVAKEQQDEMIRRMKEFRSRMRRSKSESRDENGEARSSGKPHSVEVIVQRKAEHSSPHPRLVNALSSQQKQIAKLTDRVEHLEQQLRQSRGHQSERAGLRAEDRSKDRGGKERKAEDRKQDRNRARDRAMREAERQMMNKFAERRRAMEAEIAKSEVVRREVEREMEEVAERQRDLKLGLPAAKKLLKRAERDVVQRTGQLEQSSKQLKQLKAEMAKVSDQLKSLRGAHKQLDKRRKTIEKATERPALNAKPRSGKTRRSARKQPIPDDAI